MIIAWFALLLMIVAYAVATFLQAIAATQGKATEGLDPRLLFRLAKQKTYLVAMACQGVGTLAAFLARRDLPLFLVQAAIGAMLVVTALLGIVFCAWRLPRVEIGLIVAVIAGVGILVAVAQPGPATDPGTPMVLALVVAAPIFAMLVHFAARLQGAPGAVALGGLAGAAFGSAAIASRPLMNAADFESFLTNPLLYVFLVHTVAGQLFLGMALQRGATTAASAAMNAMVAIPPAIVGLLFLNDHIKEGWQLAAGLGFTITVTATVALAWFAEPQSHKIGTRTEQNTLAGAQR